MNQAQSRGAYQFFKNKIDKSFKLQNSIVKLFNLRCKVFM